VKIKLAAFSFFFLIISSNMSAQLNFDYTEGKILLKGTVVDMQSKAILPNASIVIHNRNKGQSADAEGKFQIYVYPTDTLRFSSLGYIWKEIPVNGIPESMRYSLTILLMKDFYKLKEVTIYPFSNKREFEEAFVKGEGIANNVLVPGIEAPKYIHKEKAKFYNPISSIYERVKKKRAGNPDFKP
jgi:hypothetical protein